MVSFSDGEEQERRLSLSSNPGGNSQKLPSAAPVSSIKLNDAPPAVASTSKPNHGQSQESGSHDVDLSKVKSEPEALEEKPKISVNPETKPEASAEMEVEREVNRLEELFRTKANPAELQAKLRILKTMCPELFQLKDDEPGGGTAGKWPTWKGRRYTFVKFTILLHKTSVKKSQNIYDYISQMKSSPYTRMACKL